MHRTQSPSTEISIGAFENGVRIQAIFIHHPQRELHEVHYARCVGIPKFLVPPVAFGIATRLTGCGRQVRLRSCSWSPLSNSSSRSANAAIVTPSMPALPLFSQTRCQASSRLFGS